jgi:rRNA-processing protein EBP2
MAPPNVITNLSASPPTAEKRSKGEQKSARVAKQLPLPDNDDLDNTSETDEDSGVDQEGLENLVRALGEDGLDEFDLAQLRMLADEGESDEEEDAGPTTQSEDEEQAGEEEADEEIALDDEDIDSVDEDAIPRRKIQVDNEVRPSQLPPCLLARLKKIS